MSEVTSIKNPRFERDAYGYAYLSVEINGKEAQIYAEQKLHRLGAICLGQDFSEFKFIIPDNGMTSWPGTVYSGFTNDLRVMRLFERFAEAVDGDNYTVGPVKI
jgi:hypothetical protein